MAYTAGMKAYLARADALIVPTVEVTWPGTWPAGRYSSSSFGMAGVGQFVEAVRPATFGDVTDGFDPRMPGLTELETTVTMIDRDRSLMKILEGPYDCRRTRIVAKWGSPFLAYADWEVLLDGILDRWSYHDSCLVDLTFRTDARWLDSKIPREPLSPAEWPDLPNGSRGIYLPQILGSHDGQNLSGKGFVPTVMARYSAGSLRWDVISHGNVAAPRVYLSSGGTTDRTGLPAFGLKTSGVHYAVEGYLIGGKWCTVIRWLPGQIPAVDDVVQCDVEGFRTTSDGTRVVTNPVAQMRLWLVNFGWGRWLTGPWLSEASSPLDSASWSAAEAAAELHKLEGAFYVGGTTEQRRVREVLEGWLNSWRMFRCWWTPAGKLAIRALDVAHPGVGNGDDFSLVRKEDFGEGFQVADSASGIANRVSMTHLFEAATGKSWASLDVQDLSQDEDVTVNVRMEHSAARY